MTKTLAQGHIDTVIHGLSINDPAFIIAEAGINHNGNLDIAKKLIVQAKEAGASAIKFQTYITEKRVSGNSPIFEILKKCELSFQDQEKLHQFANEEGILFFSTPFDAESIEFLANLKVPLLKVASFDIVNLPLLHCMAKTNIPIIASRGMANESEVSSAVKIFRDFDVPFALLHCISSYPNQEENSNLNVMHSLRDKFHCLVGFSDHSLGIRVPILAVAAGAKIIEKHFTLDRNMPGPDHLISADPTTMHAMVKEIRQTENILGSGEIRMIEAEKSTAIYRRVHL